MQSTECIPERNHDGLASRACEGHLQVSAVLELSAELAKLIGDSVYDLTLHVRENDASVAPDDPWIAQLFATTKLYSYSVCSLASGGAPSTLSRWYPPPDSRNRSNPPS